MLALLEVGAVGLILAVAILGLGTSSLDFASFVGARRRSEVHDADRRRPPHPGRLRRQTWAAAVLRMVPRRLRLGQRRFGRHPIRSGAERGVLRPVAGTVRVAPARAGGSLSAACDHRGGCRNGERHPDHPVRLPGGRLAPAPQLFLGRERVDRRRCARRRHALSQLRPAGTGRARVDGFAVASGRPRAGEGFAVPDRGRVATRDRKLRHHSEWRGQLLAVRHRRAFGSNEPRGHAANGWLCQRMVRVPDRLSRLPPPQSRRPTCPRSGRRGARADGRDRLRYVRESLRHRRAWAGRQSQCADLAILFRGRWLSRVGRSAAWRWNASLAHRA